jgi:CHAT domain-containing protein
MRTKIVKNSIIYIIILLNHPFLFAQKEMDDIVKSRIEIKGLLQKGKLSASKAYQSFDSLQNALGKSSNIENANLYIAKGLAMFLQNELQIAINEYKNGLYYLDKNQIKNDTLRFKIHSEIVGIAYRIPDFQQAEIHAEHCYSFYKRIKLNTETLRYYGIAFFNNYSLLRLTYNDFKTSEIFLKESLKIAEIVELKEYKSFALGNLAQNEIELGKYDSAIKYLKDAVILAVRSEDKADKYLKISNLLLRQNKLDEVLNNLKEAEKGLKKSELGQAGAKFPNYELRLALTYGKFYLAKNDLSKAKSYFEDVLNLNQKYFQAERGNLVAEALNQLGIINKDQSFFERAKKASLDSKNGIISPKTLLESQINQARYLNETNAPKAQKIYLDAIQTASRVRKSFNFSESKAFYAERVFPIYEEALIALNQQKVTSEVFFEAVEYSKNAVLADVLTDYRIKNKTIDAQLLNQEKTLLAANNKIQTKLLNVKIPDEKTKLESELNEIQLKISVLAKEIEKKSPQYFELKYRNSITNPKAIQAVLDNQTVMILFFLGKKELFIQSISKEEIIYKAIPVDSTFKNELNTFLNLLYKKPALGNYKGSALSQSLYNQLIKPIETEIRNKSRLVILRDAELNFLPFEVLESKPNHYLLNDYAVSYAYSATIWHQSLRNKSAAQNSLLSIAPYTNQNALPATFRDQTLQPLPASGDEVSKIGGTIYRDNSATKNKFIEDYRKHGIIHFATHAQIDDTDPAKSFIAFYPQGADYKLFTEELYNLNLQNTRLVVLSACEAGRGKLVNGEGLMSLARGFAYSGCPSVVTTLWNAHDESMAFLSAHLHEYLQDDLPIDIALQKAKLDYFNSKIGKELDHPYYWANFILIGNYEPVFEDKSIEWWVWGLIGLGLVVVFGLVWKWVRK